jgi:cell division protein FtsN
VAPRSKFNIGNAAFGVVLVALSAGAFAVGFHYTYGATANVNTKLPGQDNLAVKPLAKVSPTPVAARPSPSPTAAPGLVAMPADAATAAPTPRAVAPSPSPRDVFAVASAQPVQAIAAVATPAPRRATPTPAGPEIFRVQVGGFGSREQAQRQVAELQDVGINAVVVYDEGEYHAQLGAFTDRARALSVADEVNIRGYSVTIRH